MDVKKCDRCGAIYSKDDDGGLMAIGQDDYTTMFRGPKRYDLCHSCISAIYKWLDEACVPVADKRGDE